jgi:hypothetical protein
MFSAKPPRMTGMPALGALSAFLSLAIVPGAVQATAQGFQTERSSGPKVSGRPFVMPQNPDPEPITAAQMDSWGMLAWR